MKMSNSKILLISLILILLFSVQTVCALDNNDFNQNDISLSLKNDNGISDNSLKDNILRAGSDDYISISESNNPDTAGNLSLEKSNALDSNLDKLSSDGGNSTDENQNSNISFNHRTVIDFVFDENTTISDELYKPVGIWDFPYYETAQNPWLMNDTTWAYCIDGNTRDPDGAGYYPGFYKRIALTENDKFINTITGEDVLPYLRTYIYQNFNNTDKYGRSSFGTPYLLIYVFYSFALADYRNPQSIYNRMPAGKFGNIYDIVKEVMDIVDSGKGVNNSGTFYDSEFLKYQFYLFVPVSELNDDWYQTLLGFNILTKINVTKIWNDDNNSANLRPEFIDVQLYGNGESIGDTVQLSQENNWTYTFTNLPVYYLYNDDLVLTENDYIISTILEDDIDLTLKKVWNESYTGTKPTTINCRLYSNGQYLGLIRLYSYYNWENTIKNLPKYDEEGNEIVYTIEDITNYRNSTPTGYIEQNFSDVYQVKHLQYEITNEDLKNESRYVETFKDGKYIDVSQVSSSNNWTFIIYNLPVDYPENEFSIHYSASSNHINIVNYTVNELNTPDIYISINATSSELINPVMPTQDQVTNRYCKYLDIDINELLRNATITNRLEVVSVNVTKNWDDNFNQDGIRPVNIIVQLLADGNIIANITLNDSNNWSYYFKNLPIYSKGSVIKYSIQELSVANYTVIITNNTAYNWTVNNTHKPATTDINVTKIWNDNNNQDGIRPVNVTVFLLADGNVIDNITLNASNNWSALFRDLPVYNAGKVIKYEVQELSVANYTVVISNSTAYNWTLNNTHDVAVTDVNVTKVWNDNNNQDGVRPSSITVVLLADGEKINETTLSAENNWKYTFTKLPAYNEGKLIKYLIQEVNIANYTVNVTNNTAYNWTINNTHKPATTDINVTKIWNDNNNQDGIRPTNVTVVLFADGVKVNETVLNSTNGWKYSFKNLPVYNAGKVIKYTIGELEVANYTIVVSNSTTYNWTLNNTHVPAVTAINVTKVWNDNNNQDGIRPTNVTVVLVADDNVVDNVTLNTNNNWSAIFENLPVYNAGKVIKYSIQELIVANYTVTVSNSTAYNWTVKNTHTPIVTDINVTKIWNDNNNQDGIRPTNVTVVLFADGVKVNETVLNSTNGWKYSFKNLPVYNAGKVIKYTIGELEVADYTVAVTNDTAYNWTVTNNHTPIVTNISVVKVWNDNNNQDGVRPINVTVVLVADGKVVGNVTLNTSNNWKVVFEDLPVYDTSKVIKYEVQELNVANYTVAISNSTAYNWTVVNNHTALVTAVNVTKVWKDNNNNDGVRPSKVTVVLFADGVKVNETVLNSTNGWKYSFKNLPVYNAGKVIKYTIGELEVADYTVAVTNDTAYNWTVTNDHTPIVTNISVVKVWNDNNNQDGIRPTSITVVLLADGEKINETTLSAENNWKNTFTKLPAYNEGKLIKYTIQELSVANYTVNVTNNTAYNWTINNTHNPVITDINVTKIWNDNNNQDGIRPANVTVVLKADGNIIGNYTLNDKNNWSNSFKNLPIYNNGKIIEYTIEEIEVANYTTTISNITSYNFVVNNTHIPAVTTINVTKIWNDNNDQDKIRPTNIKVILLANGIEVENATLSAGNNWKYTFSNLPVYNSGKSIQYTIGEVEVSNYSVDISGENGNFTITNTHVHVYTPNMSVQKISLNKTVKVGQQVRFVIVVKNTGDCELTGVYVIDDDYTQGIVIDHMLPNSDWTFDGKSKFTYSKTLGVGESANFTVVFNTTSVGFKVNNVTAGNNITNNTVNSTNTTNVTNETEPEPPEPVPPKPVPPQPIPPSPEVPNIPSKEIIPEKHATGNPIFVLLLVLFALSANISRRKKQ